MSNFKKNINIGKTMGYRLTKITTRTGDDGSTNLGTGERLTKNHPRVEALGSLDELNSSIGIVLSEEPAHLDIVATLKRIQQDLFDLGGELCPPYRIAITPEKIQFLEENIEKGNALLPPLKEFILPGGNVTSAHCHLARTICRRAERTLVTLNQAEVLNPDILRYINRLSDLLFIIARLLSRESNHQEEFWQQDKK